MERPHHRVFVGAVMVAATQYNLSITTRLEQLIDTMFDATEVGLITRQIKTWLDVNLQLTRAEIIARAVPIVLAQRR